MGLVGRGNQGRITTTCYPSAQEPRQSIQIRGRSAHQVNNRKILGCKWLNQLARIYVRTCMPCALIPSAALKSILFYPLFSNWSCSSWFQLQVLLKKYLGILAVIIQHDFVVPR